MVNSSSKDVEGGSIREPGRRSIDFAVVIGIDHYAVAPKLQGAIADAMQFHAWLCEPGGGGLARDRAKLIASQDEPLGPLQEHVDQALCDIVAEARNAGGARRLYFHFSGHGAASAASEDVALLLAKWSRSLAQCALSSGKYRERIWRIGVFEEIVFLLDCCRSIAEGAVGSPSTIACPPRCEPIAARHFFAYATEHARRAFEVRDGKQWQGLFTRRLLEILRSATAGITAAELKKKLEYAITKGKQQPHVRNELLPDSRFGGNSAVDQGVAPRLVITLGRTCDWVRLSDGRHQELRSGPAPAIWDLPAAHGLYKLKDSTGRKHLIDHNAAVTCVEF